MASRSHVFLVLCLFAAACVACGPVGPFSAGRLGGPTAPIPASWPDLSEIENAQLETDPDDPHSINIWIVAVEGDAFVSTSLILGPEDPTEREWVQNVERTPQVRLRVDGTVYQGRLVRVGDAALRERVLAAFAAKYGELSAERRDGAWVYRLVEG